MAILVITIQVSGQVYESLGGTARRRVERGDRAAARRHGADLLLRATPMPIAVAIALTTQQSAWRIWMSDFASSAPSYLLGATAAAVVIAVTADAPATG